ncbi:MAG: hypothetical protein IPP88_02775 [Betaproteobacteria bacterium]|nr:hypothetical protein [Betaproteobacteria bacterium]
MNPLIIIVVFVVAGFSWSLIVGLRAGEFKFGNGSYGQGIARVRRDASPGAFWLVAAFQAAVILYVASFVFEM